MMDRNRILEDRAKRRREREEKRYMMDSRRGDSDMARGGDRANYDSRRGDRDRDSARGRDKAYYDYGMDSADRHYKPMEYEIRGRLVGDMYPIDNRGGDRADRGDYRGDNRRGDKADRGDYADYGDYRSDYDMDYSKEKKEYEEKLEEWTNKLKKKDKFGLKKEQVIQSAKQMGIKFDKYSEEEFYATYLMRVSDDKEMANSPQSFIISAKKFLEDDDTALTGSEKLCKYLYSIVLDEEE